MDQPIDSIENDGDSQPEAPEPPPKKRGGALWIVVLLALGVAGFGLWHFVLGPWLADPPEPVVMVADAGAADPAAEVLPQQGDALLKELAGKLSTSPLVTEWLSVEDVVRRLTAAVNLVSQGKSPAPVLSFLAPEGGFLVTEVKPKPPPRKRRRRGRREPPPPPAKLFISPKSYERYDPFANAFSSVDFSAAGRAYAGVRPYFEAAFREIARPGLRFDAALVQAIDRVLAVKLPEGKLEVKVESAAYAFVDPELEALGPIPKHLIRMGPKNARAVQAGLRAFMDAAQLEAERVP